jgi:hypothetical protein
MDMSVALLMDQLNVDDWPLSMADGSAVKLLITALATVGVGNVSWLGGGGGGGGTFLLQPTATVNTITAAAILEACNLSVALILNNLLFFKSTEFLWSKQAFHYYLV